MPAVPNAYYRTSIKALILGENNRFLLTKGESGRWDLPGGGMDWGETPQVCLAREIQEEMGLNATFIADHPSYFLSVDAKDSERWITNVIYLATLEHLEFTPSDECIGIRFFSAEEASTEVLFPNVEKFLTIYNPERH